jgi:NAD-dependent dihydropyrimidine dehydrogenase PreA subunit/nitroreductase
MIVVNQEKCNHCGLCIQICHEYCMSLKNNTLTIDYEYCSTCTQCVAVCPRQALTWDNSEPEVFNRTLYPKSEQIDELFKERRTTRDFTGLKIDKSLLEEIAGYARFAPTHNFNLRVIIIDDDQLIEQIDNLVFKFSIKIYKWIFKPSIIYSLLKLFAPDLESEYLHARPKLGNAKRRKSGFKTKPAAIILIIGDKRVPLSLESAQYALYNMDLYAQTKGIACRNLVGNQMILNRNKKFKCLIGLNKNERIFGTILLGFPAIKFRNKVTGKKIRINWNTDNLIKNQS